MPRELLAVVQKAMARAKEDRYPSARELAEDLRRFAHGQITGGRGGTRAARIHRFARRNKASIAVLTLVCVLIAIVGALR